MKKGLIISTYNGNYKNSIREPNRTLFNNIKCLIENIDLNLFDKIIIVISCEEKEEFINKKYNNYLMSLNNDKIKIIKKKNDKYLSYSSYYEGYLVDKTMDYYFFIEDDYIITKDYVKVAIDEITKNNWDYIFGDINYQHKIIHACHCLCVTKGHCLKEIFSNFYENIEKINHAHQISFFYLFRNSKYKGEDFKKSDFTLMFWNTKGNHELFYSNKDKKNLVFPTQYFYKYKINYPNNKPFNYYVL